MALESKPTGDPAVATGDAAHLLTKKEKRALQARINGAKSKGPITPEGLAKSSKNAIRHGLTANQHTLLETEFADEYEEVYNAFIADLRPVTKAELRLVEKIANIDWRAERLVMMETCVFNLEVGMNHEKILDRFASIDGIGIIVEAWKESMSAIHCLDLLRRYMGTLQHQFNTMLSNYYKLEARRTARVRGGTNLDEEWGPPYQRPRFETHLPSETEAGAEAAAPIAIAEETQTPIDAAPAVAAPEIQDQVATPTSSPSHVERAPRSSNASPARSPRPIRNEPSAPNRVSQVKRPAA